MADNQGAKPGFTYFVTDAQLDAFQTLTPGQRLQWLDEARDFSVRVAPPEAKQSWRQLRRGNRKSYELWANGERTRYSFFSEDNESARQSLSPGETLLYAFDAASWEEACAWRDEILGW